MLKVDLHTHTIASGHGFHTLDEMTKEAKKRGIEVLGITEHGPAMPDGASLNYFWTSKRLPKVINSVRVLFGVEANITNKDGNLDLPEERIEKLDIVMAGLHKKCGYEDLGKEENTEAIINAIKNPLVHMISHPYNVGFETDIEKVTEAACRHDKLLEINASYFFTKKAGFEKTHDKIKRMVEILKKKNKKIIINSDAHNMYEIGRDEEVREKFDYLGLNDEDILNNDIEALQKYFKFEL